MKRVLFFFQFFILIASGYNLHGQKLIPNTAVTGVCYAGSKVNRIYIPPPEGVKEKSKRRETGSVTVLFTGFNTESRAAVEYAANILQSFLPTGLNLTVKASWAKISDSGVLGNSRITGFVGGWVIDALKPYVYYPVALGEKIYGKKLNEAWEGDIELVINSSANWYTGTDGNTPASRYDLVTVALHELIHGLGWFDSMDADGSAGWYGINSIPVIYDTFVEDANGRKLTDENYFGQYSSELYQSLTGGQLFFKGPLSDRYMAGTRIRLYAPSRWNNGSSVSHLDESITLTENSLMTPFIDLGEAIHDPGKLTVSILGDLGWINTRIIHDAPHDTEEYLATVDLNISIHSDTLYNGDKVGLVYSFTGFESSDTIFMRPGVSQGSYRGVIPIPSYNIKLSYYFFAEDDFLRTYRSPALAELMPYEMYIGTDIIRPEIIHSPPKYFFEKIDTISLESTITDNLGIDTAYIEFRKNDETPVYYGLLQGKDDNFGVKVNIPSGLLRGGDSIQYRITAVDKASSGNISTSPETGYHVVGIEKLEPALTQYQTDFNYAGGKFYTDGFAITECPDFSNKALHSEHPYKSPEEDLKTLEFSAVLRHPIIFDPSGMVIRFREIVLVEPGEEGSVFGFTDFYDYVIIEGSKDSGKNWFAITEGYDCRHNPAWEEAYNQSVSGMNSTYQGKESMFVEHLIYPRLPDKISSGDQILIRFRLFSDPYANGWGWVIDDLRINPLVDHVEELNTSQVTIFPNPGTGRISIDPGDAINLGPVRYTVYSTFGYCIIDKKSTGGSDLTIDLTGYPSGIYIIVLHLGDTRNTFRYSLIK